MIHSNLRVEVLGSYILVAMRGTCFRAKYRKQDAPWLAVDEYAENSEAPITFSEFRALAWEAANDKARQLEIPQLLKPKIRLRGGHEGALRLTDRKARASPCATHSQRRGRGSRACAKSLRIREV